MLHPKRLIVALAVVLLAGGTAVAAASPAGAAPSRAIEPKGPITNYGSGECIAPVPDPDGGYAVNGLDIEQFTCATQFSAPQWWKWVTVGNVTYNGQTSITYHLVNMQSNQCLDDRDGSTTDRSPVQQWTCNDTSTTMQWMLGDSLGGARQLINLRAVRNGGSACLDVANGSGSDGAVLQLYHCTAQNTAQHFFVPGH
jgi:hypothetical protein